MKTVKKFYITERHNPQFDKPYYIPQGQLSKREASKKENSIYGFNNMLSYDTEQDYKKAIDKLKADGKLA